YHLWTLDWKKMVRESKFSVYPDFGEYQEGHIGLQDHGNDVWFRNIKIKEL
ncbi:MAG: family 16 glycoside hydrolase, partial [Acidobacteriota bacterium]|nr:family 16 glycoside hydrolase [Acidobacteriota bacterium]